MNRAVPLALAVLLGAAISSACGGGMSHPPYTPQITAALVEVGYPPPPARVEFIPVRPKGGTVWLDGEWGWTGSKWSWTSGRWVMPPAGASFSPWTTTRDARGTVYFASGTWIDAGGARISAPAPLAVGRAMPGDVISPEGDSQKTGATPAASVSRSAPSAPQP